MGCAPSQPASGGATLTPARSCLPGGASAPTESPLRETFSASQLEAHALSASLSSSSSQLAPSEATGRRIERRLSVSGFDAPPAESPQHTSQPPPSAGGAPVWALRTRAGCDPATGTKRNQDSAFVHRAPGPLNVSVLGVFDGHGPFGHLVAGYLCERFPRALGEQVQLGVESTQAALSLAFATCSAGLGRRGESGLDVSFSGSTAVLAVLEGPSDGGDGSSTVTCAWTGDSRCVVGRRERGGDLVAVALTEDHKPDSPAELSRIRAAGGRVEQLVDGEGARVGPHRVWLRSAWTPGLAMSRAMGDSVAQTAGVSSLPEFSEHRLCAERDEILILSSDGVWEFLSNAEAVVIASACATPDAACEALVEESARRWLHEEEGVVDDITCVVLFLRAEESSVPEQLSSPASSTLASGGSQVWASQVEEEHAAFVTKLEHGLLLPRSSPSKERLPDMSP